MALLQRHSSNLLAVRANLPLLRRLVVRQQRVELLPLVVLLPLVGRQQLVLPCCMLAGRQQRVVLPPEGQG